jgi:gamma-glutamyltranspeptidase/glutathione hydrolase
MASRSGWRTITTSCFAALGATIVAVAGTVAGPAAASQAAVAGLGAVRTATAPGMVPGKQAVAVGTGGAVASDDVQATQAGMEVLRRGGNAVDAAVSVAATLGVTDPFVAGIGGGGFLVYYDARTRQVYTIVGRETAPGSAGPGLFIDPAGFAHPHASEWPACRPRRSRLADGVGRRDRARS